MYSVLGARDPLVPVLGEVGAAVVMHSACGAEGGTRIGAEGVVPVPVWKLKVFAAESDSPSVPLMLVGTLTR